MFEEEFCYLSFFIAKNLVGSVRCRADRRIFKIFVGDVEGELEHPEDERTMSATVVNKAR